MICHRCYGRLRRRLDAAPDLVMHLRTMAHNVAGAQRYDHQPTGQRELTSAPTNPDLLDATRDIMSTVYAGELPATATPAEAYRRTIDGVRHLIEHFDELTNDAESVAQWWSIVMTVELSTAPHFWTITRAFARWPLEDRRRWAKTPCPACDLRTVVVTPPTRAGAPTWYACRECDWERSDQDTDRPWVDVFGEYDPTRPLVDSMNERD